MSKHLDYYTGKPLDIFAEISATTTMLRTLLGLLFLTSWPSTADLALFPTTTTATTKLGCQEKCGSISIPYPFGLGDDPKCFQESKFQLYCNTTFDPPLLAMASMRSIPIINISLEGQLTTLLWVSHQCHSINGTLSEPPFYLQLRLTKDFRISNTRNKFFGIGCDTRASIRDFDEKNFQSGCISYCTNVKSVINESCTGIGCCQTSIPKDVGMINVVLGSYSNHQYSWDFSHCSYAFLADDQWFKFHASDLLSFPKRVKYKFQNLPATPVALDWSIGNLTLANYFSSSTLRYNN